MTRLPIEWTDLDERIWREELDEFVPFQIFDIHTHMTRWEFNLDPKRDQSYDAEVWRDMFPISGHAEHTAVESLLMPGREVHRLAFGYPFVPCDTCAQNEFVSVEVGRDPDSAGLCLMHPNMPAEKVESEVKRLGLIGLKPYRFYAPNPEQCRITDFLPEEHIAVAHENHWLIMLHLSRPHGCADETNLADLTRLCVMYPNATWILAHNARGYTAWAMEKAGPALQKLKNVFLDISTVTDTDALDAALTYFGPERMMYGSDDIGNGCIRGKYVTFGYSWGYLSPQKHSMSLSHCDGRMTFVRYEMLRSFRRSALRHKLSAGQLRSFFHDTAARLVAATRGH